MCYSFGKARRDVNYKSDNPGPGNYNQESKLLFNKSTYKFGTSSRGFAYKSDVPGPGSYESNKKGKSGYSFGVKYKGHEVDHCAPGPGAYTSKYNYEPNIKYSFGAKTWNKDISQSHVGPGSYEYKSTLQVPTSKIGTSKRGNLGTSDTPGPGSYGNIRPQTSGPKFGFGSSSRGINYGDGAKPGPGSYEYKTTLTKQAPTMSGKNYRSYNDAVKNPGPGSYDPNGIKDKSSVKFGKQNRDNYGYNQSVPGPGSYDATHYIDKQKGPNYRIGSAHQRPNLRPSDAPGPGNYQVPSKLVEGPKYGFGAKTSSQFGNYNNTQPGPGSYNDDKFGSIYEKVGAPKFGKEMRSGFSGNAVPGPASYDPKLKPGGPKYGFGSSPQRTKMGANDAPGPGNYNVPSKFSDVPKFLLPNRPY